MAGLKPHVSPNTQRLPYRRLSATARVTILMFVAAGMSYSQTSGAGVLSGTVRDPRQATVPAASVSVLNTGTGIVRALATNDDGRYVVPSMPPGRYEITVSKPGFATLIRKNLDLQVGRTLTVDFELRIEASSESVTVSAETPAVDPEKTEMSQVVSQTQQENLPIAGRRWADFVLLTPNVTTDGTTGMVSFRGVSGLYNSSAVDGATASQGFFSDARVVTLPYLYSMDSIREFQSASSNYSAELGQAAGGFVNAVTKSGSNTVHGGLFYFLRYPTLNALDPIQKASGNFVQPVKQQQQFGGSVGGPIIKDRLFYFLTYDGSRKVNPIAYSSFATFPQACPSQVSATLCTAANQYFQAQLGSFPRYANQDLGFAKLDAQINRANHASASFDLTNYVSPNSSSSAVTVNNSSASANATSLARVRTGILNLDTTITPSLLNNFRFQWSADFEAQLPNGPGPSVSVANVMGYGMAQGLPRTKFPDEHRLELSDKVSKIAGSHTFKAGVDVNVIHEVIENLFQGGGVYSYSGSNAFRNWIADVTGTNLADGLTGRHWATFVQAYDPYTKVGTDDFHDVDYAAFVEDSWKARRNLTLNLGVRYDVQDIPQPSKPNVSSPLTQYYTSRINIDRNNFAPRIGLAWSPGRSTVVRIGYGIFYGKTSNSTFFTARVENGVYQLLSNCTPSTCPALTFPNLIYTPTGGPPQAPFPGALTPQVISFTPPAATNTTRGLAPDWVNPLSHEGEATIERGLRGNLSVSASYVVSRTLHLPEFVDANVAPATTTRTYDVTNASGITQSTLALPFYTARIEPATGPVLAGYSDLNSWYNSMVLSLRKPASGGLEFAFNYTLSKAVDGGQVNGSSGPFNGTLSFVDPRDRKLEYGLSVLDQRHRFVGNVVWIPQWTRRIGSRPLKAVADGFTFSAIVTIGSGQPVTGMLNGFPSGGVDGGLTGGTVNNSGTATAGRYPGVARSSFPGPGLGNVDFRVGREFRVTERLRLSLRGEAFNLFNSTNIFSVNSTLYNYTASGSGLCAGHANGCLVANTTFLAPATSGTSLYGARQLQFSGRLTF